MEARLSVINRHLAKAVFVAAATFSVLVTLVAAMTGQTLLLLFTAVGVASAAYAVQVIQPDAVEGADVITLRRGDIADAA